MLFEIALAYCRKLSRPAMTPQDLRGKGRICKGKEKGDKRTRRPKIFVIHSLTQVHLDLSHA
jgi:hypothetical protein